MNHKLLEPFLPRQPLNEAVAGLVLGLLAVVYSASYAALIFTGPLADRLPAGIGAALFGALALGVIGAIFSGLAGAIYTPQDRPAVLLAVPAAAAAAAGGVSAVLVLIGVSTLVCGIALVLLGRFRLTRMIRYIPYPVIGGFVAGTGWLIVRGAFSFLTGTKLSWTGLAAFGERGVLLRWVPSLAFAAALILVTRRVKHSLTLPAMLAAGLALFYAAVGLSGRGVSAIQSEGWLLGPFPEGALWELPSVLDAPWGALWRQQGEIGAMILIVLISVLFNVTALELAAPRDVDLDREVQVVGLANILAGFGAGLVGYPSLSLSALNAATAGRSRFASLVAAGVCAFALAGGSGLLSYFPRPLLGAMLFMMGWSFLQDWLNPKKLAPADAVLVWIILIAIASLGFLPGVAVGLAVAVILFAVEYGRIDAIRDELDGRLHHSNVERSQAQRSVLQERGGELAVFRLQGYLFFGTAHRACARILRAALGSGRTRARFVLIDFHRTTGADSSAVLAFTKLHKQAAARGVTLGFCGLNENIARRLLGRELADCPVFSDLDLGVEWWEKQALKDIPGPESALKFEGVLGRLSAFLEKKKVPQGSYFFREGEPSDGLFFLESGSVEVRKEADGRRLKTMGPGTLVGEMGLYTTSPRSASVLALEDCSTQHLSRRRFEELGRENPQAERLLHHLVISLLSQRLEHANRERAILLR